MNSTIKKTTVRGFLNKVLRIPQRTTSTQLSTGVTTVLNTYKNKVLIHVFSEKDNRFNYKI